MNEEFKKLFDCTVCDYRERNRKLQRLTRFMSVLMILVSIMSLCQSARIAKLEDTNEMLHRRVVQLQDKYGEQGE